MCVGFISKGSLILVRVCILYVLNLTIESIYYFEHKPSVFVVDSCGRCCQDIKICKALAMSLCAAT